MQNVINKTKSFLLKTGLVIGGIFIGWLFFSNHKENNSLPETTENNVVLKSEEWTCSMHPQIRQKTPGKCPICAMDLIPVHNEDAGNEDMNIISISESAMKIADVQTTIVQKSIPVKEIRLPGKVKPDERKIAIITSRFPGRIEKLFINFTGQEVQMGEKLATIYSPELITAQKELFEAIKFKQTNPEYYKSARNKLKLWSLNESQIENIEKSGEPQNFYDVLSPLSGTVMKRLVTLGDYIMEGAMLFEVVDLSTVWILFDAYESDLPWIRLGDNVLFEVHSQPGKMMGGKVTFIDPGINPETRVAYIRSEVVNTNKLLKPEMFVRGIIKSKLPSVKDAFIVPKSSVLWTGKKSIVYIKLKDTEKPTFEFRVITLGEETDKYYIVKEGLEEGEEIVTNGVFSIDAAAQLSGRKSMMQSGEDNNPESTSDLTIQQEDLTETKFNVSGECEMCKETIEKTAKSIKGVNFAKWNSEDGILVIKYLSTQAKIDDIHKAIAKKGYDTDKEKALDKDYLGLPDCCKYRK